MLTAPPGAPALVHAQWTTRARLAVLALGAFGTAIANVVMAVAAGRLGVTRASGSAFIIPVVALLLGVDRARRTRGGPHPRGRGAVPSRRVAAASRHDTVTHRNIHTPVPSRNICRRSPVMTMPRVVRGTAALVVALVAGGSPLRGQSAPATAAPAVQPAPPAVPAILKVPSGFAVSVFASGLTGSRLMAVSPEGVLVVAKRAEVVALPDANHDGVAEPTVLSSGMTYAHSVAFNGGYLYVGTTPAVMRVKWANGAVAGPVETYVELPSSAPAMHTSHSIAFGPDGRLYVGIGSSCNVCIESDPRRTTIQVFDGPGSKGRAYASGLHNPVGFDWDPVTRRMWAADTGQEQLGDDYPPDEINLIEDGKHYGFPSLPRQQHGEHRARGERAPACDAAARGAAVPGNERRDLRDRGPAADRDRPAGSHPRGLRGNRHRRRSSRRAGVRIP